MEFDIKNMEVYIKLAKKREHNFIKISFGRMYTKKYMDSRWKILI